MTSASGDGTRLDLRLVPAALCGWAVTAAGIVWSPGGTVAVLVAATAITAAVRWWGSGDREFSSVVRAVAAAVAGVAAIGTGFAVAVALRVHEVRAHPIAERYGTVVSVVVTPTETPHSLGDGRLMFHGDLRVVDGGEASGRIVAFTPVLGFADLTAGRPARFSARITRPTRRDLTVAVVSATGKPTLGEPSPVQAAAHRVRAAFAAAARAVLPADQAAMLPSLVLGDTSALTGQTRAEFRTAGLTHLTAVSGANVTIVCGAVLFTAGLIGPRAAVVLSGAVLLAFVVVVQPSASVLRAAVMGAITLLALLSRRRRQAIPVLSASVIALMIGAPELAVDVGFALSVTATAALVLIAPRWSRRMVARGWPKPLADALSIAVAAQLVTAPLVAGISGTFSLVSVGANLAVAVVIAPITVIGTAAAATCLLWPAGAQLLIRFTGPELWWLLRVAHWAASLPAASVRVPSGTPGVLIVAAVGVAVVLLWRWRWFRLGMGAATICLFTWAALEAVGRP